jgi:hypothetical protein
MVAADPLQFLGIEQLWNFVLAEHPGVGFENNSVQLLTYLNSRSCLVEEMKPNTKLVAQNFIRDCMQRMQAEVQTDINA